MTRAERRIPVAPGVALRVLVGEGDGLPFLLVHGLASNARMWDGVAARLHELGHPTAAVDLRGHGGSDKPDDGYDFETVVADLAAVVDELGWDRPVAAGQSWGGNLVLELAWKHPEAVRGVACVDGGTIELHERFPVWEDCQRALAPPRLAGMSRAHLEATIRQMHPDWPEVGIQGVLANFETRADGTVAPWLTFERHMRVLRGLWEHRPSLRYPDIDVPVLLVPAAGRADPAWEAATRTATERALAALPVARARWFDPADHDIHAQHPVELADLLHESVAEGFFR